ncbi:uncharacterized protein E0L32_008241 [Thyridium curvatum]|uniref:Phosphatidylethanolamine-binding protein n=1 Tax=Thyridium curvatum TaxID=1093900 RepID=A0A507AM43_9PEZI|nr:uncharacterized protein E0L32_008241 [Thyridium curvatum]TPX10852.1 hypothetical protein E0L32_008241 [Thyridium curvatum]
MSALFEVTLAWLFKSAKGRDGKAFCTRPAFTDQVKEPTIRIASPDCGETGATFSKEYMAEGGGRFPTLEWEAPADIAPKVKEWLLVVEDPDAPVPTPFAHGSRDGNAEDVCVYRIYPGIPASQTRIEPKDLEVQDKGQSLLKSGIYYGANSYMVYIPPKPLMNHGVHRYFFQVVALSEPLDRVLLQAKATREQVADAIQGKVLGWGLWTASCERRW